MVLHVLHMVPWFASELCPGKQAMVGEKANNECVVTQRRRELSFVQL